MANEIFASTLTVNSAIANRAKSAKMLIPGDMDQSEADTALVRALVEHAGMRPSPMAKEIGVAATTITRPFKGEASSVLSRATIEKLRARWPDFPGWADLPPEPPSANATTPFHYEGSSLYRMPRDLPVYGSALGAEKVVEGEAIELTTLNRSEVIEYRERPPILNGKSKVYGLYVQGSSMDPAFSDGDLLIAQETSAIGVDDFVVVYLRPQDSSDDGKTARSVLVKRLVRRTGQHYVLRQYQPDKTFTIAREDVLRVDKALRLQDVL